MKATPTERRSDHAFTILELLVVLIVLALMASMMIPGLARTKPNAKVVQCLNNLRQLASAMALYTQDNHELFPPNPDDGNTTPGYNWCAGNVQIGCPDEF